VWLGDSTPSVDIDGLRATYIIRRLIEPYAMKRAVARMSTPALNHALTLNGQLALAAQRGDFFALLDADRRLHFHFFEYCGAPGLIRHIHALWAVSGRHLHRGALRRHQDALAEHQVLVQAAGRREPSAIALATEAHLRAEYMSLMQELTGSQPSDPFSDDLAVSEHPL
jgi:DNA-binding GntR family transcriptional regulator